MRDRIGRRGLSLAVLGLMDLFFGLYLLLGGRLEYPLQLTNTQWGWAWTVIGAFLLAGAAVRRDAPWFAAAVFVKAAWAAEFVRLAFISEAGQWPRAVFWCMLAALVLVIASWPEAPRGGTVVQRAEKARGGDG